MGEDLRAELTKLRALIAQTQAMGLDILELEDRAAEIEALLAESEAAPPGSAPQEEAVGTLQILTPDMHAGDWEGRPVALVGGTADIMPDHRAALMDACVVQGIFPIAVGQLPADPIEAVRGVLTVVNNVSLYIGIFTYRYGRIPKGADWSIPEIEYNRVVESGVPRLVFFMDRKHPMAPEYIDRGEAAARLADFKARLRRENAVHTFVSVDDLREQAAAWLAALVAR
ncbi:MAG: DUF4062 domain-containing protein [Anaerolineae bacterium]|nr:DUF4062 domain-containing protein [Anaerolineae bacterium]